MKSIMEQAGSIVKAIEKAWNRAGKPQDFSVKVFEHEQKNFFGMTTKPAKIGIFFEEKPVSVSSKDRRVRKKYTPTQVKQQPVRPFQKTENPSFEKRQILWNDEMVNTAQDWVKKTLVLMGLPNIQFNAKVVGKNLKFEFDTPVIGNRMKEKQLFRSFAYLIMATLRNQFKQEFRDLKIVLIRS